MPKSLSHIRDLLLPAHFVLCARHGFENCDLRINYTNDSLEICEGNKSSVTIFTRKDIEDRVYERDFSGRIKQIKETGSWLPEH